MVVLYVYCQKNYVDIIRDLVNVNLVSDNILYQYTYTGDNNHKSHKKKNKFVGGTRRTKSQRRL